MDAMLENMRNTFGNGVRKMFSTNIGVKTMEKPPSDFQIFKMSLCNICAMEGRNVPFIVLDICKFISAKAMKLEGIFRVSAPIRQVNELRDEYESNCNFQSDYLLNRTQNKETTGHAAAGLLKQFLRQLTEPLIPNNILDTFMECKPLSDEAFAENICSRMKTWPDAHRCTLLYLLSFLHAVAQESENRMSINGLAVVFGPNVFKLPDGIEGLQAQGVANMAFERLLSCSDILCKGCGETTPPMGKKTPPTRPAPPSPRPLPQLPTSPQPGLRRPAPPIPFSHPEVVLNIESAIDDEKDSSEKEEFWIETKEEERREEEIPEEIQEESESCDESGHLESSVKSEKNEECVKILDTSIRKIVQTRLFNSSESSSVSDDAESLMRAQANRLLPSATAGRNRGPKNRRKPSRTKPLLNKVQLDNDSEEETVAIAKKDSTLTTPITKTTGSAPIAIVTRPTEKEPTKTKNVPTVTETITKVTSSFDIGPIPSNNPTSVMTPDSGCVVEDSDLPRNSSPIKRELASLDAGRSISPIDVFIPKLNLRSSLDDEEMAKIKNATPPPSDDLVPQLDLSSVVEPEDFEKPRPLPRKPTAEKIPSKPTEQTPPRPVPRTSPVKQVAKKKKKQQNHKKPTSKIPSETSNKSDLEITDDTDETMEQARDRMLQVLRENRRVAGRPFDISRMAHEELRDEKVSMQRELLKFEGKHGRPTTKQSKQLMREIYDRYRAVKRAVTKWQKEVMDENENTIATTSQELGDSFAVTRPLPPEVTSCDDSDVTMEGGDIGTSQLIQQVNELRGKRRRLRKILRDFENERKVGASLDNGGVVPDRGVMRSEYKQYRDLKNKLHSLEVTLAKRGIELS